MKITRIYNDSNGNSHFEDVAVALSDYGAIGFLSQNIKVSQLQFRKVVPEYDYDFHCAPQKQYIVLLDGGVEIETSLGQKRVFQIRRSFISRRYNRKRAQNQKSGTQRENIFVYTY
ncbi:hypothetical protein VO54_01033 [Elizabethkingia miricola]|nr:hypothetical protein VO54_01033 [Elizabethkingia miricola]